jgi:hypothetical protein
MVERPMAGREARRFEARRCDTTDWARNQGLHNGMGVREPHGVEATDQRRRTRASEQPGRSKGVELLRAVHKAGGGITALDT